MKQNIPALMTYESTLKFDQKNVFIQIPSFEKHNQIVKSQCYLYTSGEKGHTLQQTEVCHLTLKMKIYLHPNCKQYAFPVCGR